MRTPRSMSIDEFRARLEALCEQSARDLEATRVFTQKRRAREPIPYLDLTQA